MPRTCPSTVWQFGGKAASWQDFLSSLIGCTMKESLKASLLVLLTSLLLFSVIFQTCSQKCFHWLNTSLKSMLIQCVNSATINWVFTVKKKSLSGLILWLPSCQLMRFGVLILWVPHLHHPSSFFTHNPTFSHTYCRPCRPRHPRQSASPPPPPPIPVWLTKEQPLSSNKKECCQLSVHIAGASSTSLLELYSKIFRSFIEDFSRRCWPPKIFEMRASEYILPSFNVVQRWAILVVFSRILTYYSRAWWFYFSKNLRTS